MNTRKKVIAIFSSVMLLSGSVLPVFAESSISITGNGSDSSNSTNVAVTQNSEVTQSNSANIVNNVSSSSNSGNNSASHNTGGNVGVGTGNAQTQVSVVNTANSNVAAVTDCNCETGNLDVNVDGNADGSKNTANTAFKNTVTFDQTNDSDINNNVRAGSNSGNNGADHNTRGSVSVSTGNAATGVLLSTMANQNLAQVGSGAGEGSDTSVTISGNGSNSRNKVNLGLTDWVVLGQTNEAHVDNSVNAKSNTGENEANHNTGGRVLGGDVTIDTGAAVTEVSADTAVNFNQAVIGCDCLMGVTASIADNGASDGHWWNSAKSTINASLVNGLEVGQANGGSGIDNNLFGKSNSGENDSHGNRRTDSSITTGDTWTNASVTNEGNANIFGSGSESFPTFTFSLVDLLSALGM